MQNADDLDNSLDISGNSSRNGSPDNALDNSADSSMLNGSAHFEDVSFTASLQGNSDSPADENVLLLRSGSKTRSSGPGSATRSPSPSSSSSSSAAAGEEMARFQQLSPIGKGGRVGASHAGAAPGSAQSRGASGSGGIDSQRRRSRRRLISSSSPDHSAAAIPSSSTMDSLADDSVDYSLNIGSSSAAKDEGTEVSLSNISFTSKRKHVADHSSTFHENEIEEDADITAIRDLSAIGSPDELNATVTQAHMLPPVAAPSASTTSMRTTRAAASKKSSSNNTSIDEDSNNAPDGNVAHRTSTKKQRKTTSCDDSLNLSTTSSTRSTRASRSATAAAGTATAH